MMDDYKPHFKNSSEFTRYLMYQLIPDLINSGNIETASDFKESVYWIYYYKYSGKQVKK
jgi:hypothetical protein